MSRLNIAAIRGPLDTFGGPRLLCVGGYPTKLSATAALVGVLALGGIGCLPLHVAGVIRTSAGKRFYVIHDVALTRAGRFAGAWTRIRANESAAGCGAAFRRAPARRLGCFRCVVLRWLAHLNAGGTVSGCLAHSDARRTGSTGRSAGRELDCEGQSKSKSKKLDEAHDDLHAITKKACDRWRHFGSKLVARLRLSFSFVRPPDRESSSIRPRCGACQCIRVAPFDWTRYTSRIGRRRQL